MTVKCLNCESNNINGGVRSGRYWQTRNLNSINYPLYYALKMISPYVNCKDCGFKCETKELFNRFKTLGK